MSTTNNPDDPRLKNIGADGMQETYLVLSEHERAKGFVRRLRRSYIHVGRPGPCYELRDLTPEERERYADIDYVKYEAYPAVREPGAGSTVGRLWTQGQLDAVDKGCGAETTMGLAIAETYARNPGFYGGTFCVSCGAHFPVGKDGEFVWADAPTERVGT